MKTFLETEWAPLQWVNAGHPHTDDKGRHGDYVLLHAGFAIQRLDEEEAQETLRLFAEMAAMEGSP
ncbi:MAG TPA: HypC/HybG/HupF family hydrogenase formation chaperone [Anaerolineae bacterium]|nr:HypC/HybG/HupF family hydrogenase formation chaperone [Anaerolineae bacterium]